MPGVDDSTYAQDEAHIASEVGPHLLEGQVGAEPKLAPYVTR
jgi:hypothetical protein